MRYTKEYNLMLKLFSVCNNRGFKTIGNNIILEHLKKWAEIFSQEEKESLAKLVGEDTFAKFEAYKSKTGFVEGSKFENICVVCKEKISIGEPIFIRNAKNPLHIVCGDQKDRENIKFLKWALIEKSKSDEEYDGGSID